MYEEGGRKEDMRGEEGTGRRGEKKMDGRKEGRRERREGEVKMKKRRKNW